MEVRGRDIGALMVRRQLDPESNLCYGEGGAGDEQACRCIASVRWSCGRPMMMHI